MKSLFADTFYFLALLNPDDSAHDLAHALTANGGFRLVTTGWILTELADACSEPDDRPRFLDLYRFLRNQPLVEIVEPSAALLEAGINFFERRPDKSWSLTDCISFLVMGEYGLREALTGDHHFQQAGFVAMLRE